MIFLSGRFVKRKSIPAGHWQIIVDSLGHQDLMKINDSVMECCRTCGQIKIPHTQKFLIKHHLFFFNVIPEILFPMKQCLIVMQTEILDIQGMEIVLCHMVQDLT